MKRHFDKESYFVTILLSPYRHWYLCLYLMGSIDSLNMLLRYTLQSSILNRIITFLVQVSVSFQIRKNRIISPFRIPVNTCCGCLDVPCRYKRLEVGFVYIFTSIFE